MHHLVTILLLALGCLYLWLAFIILHKGRGPVTVTRWRPYDYRRDRWVGR